MALAEEGFDSMTAVARLEEANMPPTVKTGHKKVILFQVEKLSKPHMASISLDDYKIIRELGRGAQGTTLLVHQRVDGTPFAIKRIDAPDLEAQNRGLDEANQMQHLRDDLLVSLHRCFLTQDGGRFQVCRSTFLNQRLLQLPYLAHFPFPVYTHAYTPNVTPLEP